MIKWRRGAHQLGARDSDTARADRETPGVLPSRLALGDNRRVIEATVRAILRSLERAPKAAGVIGAHPDLFVGRHVLFGAVQACRARLLEFEFVTTTRFPVHHNTLARRSVPRRVFAVQLRGGALQYDQS